MGRLARGQGLGALLGKATGLASASQLGGHRAAWSLREVQQGRLWNKRPVPATGQASSLPSQRPGTTALVSRALGLAQPRCGTYLVPHSNHWPLHSPRPSDQSFRDQGGAALGLLGPGSVCLSQWGWAGPGRRKGGWEWGWQGRGCGLICMRGPWPLSGPPHCVPGLAHNHSLCGGLSHPGELKRGGGPGPPPASKGKFLLPISAGRWPSRPKWWGQVAGPRQGLSLSLGAGFAVLYPHLLVLQGEAARQSTL